MTESYVVYPCYIEGLFLQPDVSRYILELDRTSLNLFSDEYDDDHAIALQNLWILGSSILNGRRMKERLQLPDFEGITSDAQHTNYKINIGCLVQARLLNELTGPVVRLLLTEGNVQEYLYLMVKQDGYSDLQSARRLVDELDILRQ